MGNISGVVLITEGELAIRSVLFSISTAVAEIVDLPSGSLAAKDTTVTRHLLKSHR